MADGRQLGARRDPVDDGHAGTSLEHLSHSLPDEARNRYFGRRRRRQPLRLVGEQVPQFHFGIGITILIGWAETNRRHHIVIVLEHEDGGEPLMRFEADLETGPPGAVEGSDQRIVMAFSGQVVVPTPGGYGAGPLTAGPLP